jgi:nucleoside-diphosphate-sugar epimerase
MTVLVTGANGFLGAALVRRLLAEGRTVRMLVRSRERATPLTSLGAEAAIGNITDPGAVRDALDGVAVVYHLAGRLLKPDVPAEEYRATHVEGTRVLVAACHERPTLERLVHCSTTGVLGVTGRRPADEDAPFRPTNIYEATKAQAEIAVREAMEGGLRAVIVRPGLVYGPGDLHLLGFFRSVLRRQFRSIGRRAVWLHPIYIDDLVEAMVMAGTLPSALGECFHLAGRSPVTLAELAAEIARAQGTAVPTGFIPLPAARTLAVVGDMLPPRLRRAAPLTSTRLDFLTHSRVYDVSKAERRLRFKAMTDLATGIARSVAWYRDHGYLPAIAAA